MNDNPFTSFLNKNILKYLKRGKKRILKKKPTLNLISFNSKNPAYFFLFMYHYAVKVCYESGKFSIFNSFLLEFQSVKLRGRSVPETSTNPFQVSQVLKWRITNVQEELSSPPSGGGDEVQKFLAWNHKICPNGKLFANPQIAIFRSIYKGKREYLKGGSSLEEGIWGCSDKNKVNISTSVVSTPYSSLSIIWCL